MRRELLLLPLLLSCSSIFGDRADPVDAAGDPLVVESETAEFTGPVSFEDEFPFVRIQDHLDGTYTALLTVPKGSGAAVEATLREFADCLKAETPTATVSAKANAGLVYHGANAAWDSSGMFNPVEDLLVIRGEEDDLRELFSLVDFWYNSGPLVEIQAQVFETRRTEGFERGVAELSGNPIFKDEQGLTFLRSIGASLPLPTAGGDLELGLIDSSFQVNAALHLLEQEGWVDILSQPSIVTRNGVAASVESSENIPYLEVNTITAGGVTYKIGKNPTGITLNVTPFLVGTDTIHLVINVDVSRIAGEFELGIAGSDTISAPSTTTRKAKTEVYVRDGETVVIGGMLLTGDSYEENKIPVLGDLPLVGWLFSSRDAAENKTEVFFMIKPILKDSPSISPLGELFNPFEELSSND